MDQKSMIKTTDTLQFKILVTNLQKKQVTGWLGISISDVLGHRAGRGPAAQLWSFPM